MPGGGEIKHRMLSMMKSDKERCGNALMYVCRWMVMYKSFCATDKKTNVQKLFLRQIRAIDWGGGVMVVLNGAISGYVSKQCML